MQDTSKTLETYEEVLYPILLQQGINSIVEDKQRHPHNNQTIRDSHHHHDVWIVDYEATEDGKEEIKDLVWVKVQNYPRKQDKTVQTTKQTNELDRLPV